MSSIQIQRPQDAEARYGVAGLFATNSAKAWWQGQ